MKKSVKNKNSKDIWRWIVLVPAICVTWLVVVFGWAFIEGFLYRWEFWQSLGESFIIVDFFILPSITIFFVARWIAPKYKNITAISAVVLCILWGVYFLYGLSHMAY